MNRRFFSWLSSLVVMTSVFWWVLPVAVTPVSSIAHARHYGPDDNVSCAGPIEAPNPDWATLTELDSLGDIASTFVGQPGRGGLCKARVFTISPKGQGRLKVYRVWDSTGGVKWGRWWTFARPGGSEDAWRRTHGLCPSTGSGDKLDKMMTCTLKVGAEFATGPGQSKDCTIAGAVQRIPQTPVNSVFMALGPGTYTMWLEGCQETSSSFTSP